MCFESSAVHDPLCKISIWIHKDLCDLNHHESILNDAWKKIVILQIQPLHVYIVLWQSLLNVFFNNYLTVNTSRLIMIKEKESRTLSDVSKGLNTISRYFTHKKWTDMTDKFFYILFLKDVFKLRKIISTHFQQWHQ